MIGLAQVQNWLAARGESPVTSRILALDTANGPVYAVGDVHGCKHLLMGLLTRIEEDAAAFPGQPTIVLLGDVIDRGPNSAAILDDLVLARGMKGVKAILGNHERMMLSFFTAPKRNAGWLDLGGFETLRSYGLALTAQEVADISQRRLMQILAAHVPKSHLDWLAALPHGFRLTLNGDAFLLVHAGFDPSVPDTAQQEDVVLWGRKPQAVAGIVAARIRCVQGHEIVSQPDLKAQCIQIDTGAWRTGRLTALRLALGIAPALVVQCQRRIQGFAPHNPIENLTG